ncbi:MULTISPECIES: aminotransferase class V-fold PLP-dependent enzyme [unclassified Haladaptatus]|uniref:aminotransferase class V-fold PLP-dependent enzyme n=1 Tax=unclassified Haladaptatus TaxID=2622732 RepID=UPI0023E77AEB|nr:MULTISPECIES: aminotransferase class V-fold PLP-dependent enzyme [unclassified Haladaptatus]
MSGTSIYDDLGVPRVVNATGTKTRIGGSRIRPEAVEAMARAAEDFVRISDLQARASTLIQECTNAEAGYVASGASAAMLLGAAACIAGDDLGVMAQLPDTTGVADEIVMPRTHRTGYDHALRAAGATIVDVGTNDHYLGTGAANTEPWEIEAAIGEDTAAVAYVQKEYTTPDLETVVEIAHDHDVPVIVDAAAELPPKRNLSRFVDLGADLVVFSGGKAIRGPQSTGILAGRAALIESAALQHLDMHAAAEVWEPPTDLINRMKLYGVPRQGIGRSLKVGKEELVGLIRALELFMEEDTAELQREWNARIDIFTETLDTLDGVTYEVTGGQKVAVAPEILVTVDASSAETDATDLVSALRRETPRIFVGADSLADAAFTINPMCLTDEEAEYVADRLSHHL